MYKWKYKVYAWLELVRPPNLFTVPGDPLAGYLLVRNDVATSTLNPITLILVMCISLFSYMSGLISNDIADFKEDSRDRSERPLPSNRINLKTAVLVSFTFAISALLFAYFLGKPVFLMAGLLHFSILLYNCWLKRFTWFGALTMGLCRALSLLLGAVAAGWVPAHNGLSSGISIVALGMLLYIAGITVIADRETTYNIKIGFRRWFPALIFLGMTIYFLTNEKIHPVTVILSFSAFSWSALQGARLRDRPSPAVLGSSIGNLIRGVLIMQAAICANGGTAGIIAATSILVLWPFGVIVGKRFYAT